MGRLISWLAQPALFSNLQNGITQVETNCKVGPTMRWLRIFFITVLISALQAKAAEDANWVELVAQGYDQKAAVELLRFIDQMPPTSDPMLREYLRETAYSLDVGMQTCAESEKIIVFRSTELDRDRRDVLYGPANRPIIVSKALRNSQWKLSPEKLRRFGSRPFWELITQHSHNTSISNDTPLISSSYDPGVTSGGAGHVVLVMKLDPRRLIESNSHYHAESETLLPFFVHSNELMAVLRIRDEKQLGSTDQISGGDFKIQSRHNELAKMTLAESTSLIQEWAKRNRSSLLRSSTLNTLLDRKTRAAVKSSLARPLADSEARSGDDEKARFLSDPQKLKKALKVSESWSREKSLQAYANGQKILEQIAPYAEQNLEIYAIVAKIAENAEDIFPRNWQFLSEKALIKVKKAHSKNPSCQMLFLK